MLYPAELRGQEVGCAYFGMGILHSFVREIKPKGGERAFLC
ncbi:hypothetical protein OQH61_01230 [Helicobacter sp. MIT 21-1697]|nr:hypothetical protein [Helicobacter sp. MIT 21-1697]MCX2716362.1 hypothetical protein [Helicobacter sp. MIT 21-1697]